MKQAKQAKQAPVDTFVFYPSFYEQLRAIKNNEVRLRLYEATVEYGILGIVPDFSEIDKMGMLDGVFAAIKYMIDSAKSKRDHISDERSKSGKKGGAPKGNQNARKRQKTSKTSKTSVDVDVDNIKKLSNDSKESADEPRNGTAKRTAFVVPEIETVKDFFRTIHGTETDAECFYDHFTANGWRAGKNPMKDWKAAARNWMRKKPEFTLANTSNHEAPSLYKDL